MKMSLVKVKNKYQIVIPDGVRKKIGLEVGDILDVEEKNGKLILRPVVVVDKSQAYFWTDEWQRGEREAEEEIKRGEISGPFKDAKSLIAHLRKKK